MRLPRTSSAILWWFLQVANSFYFKRFRDACNDNFFHPTTPLEGCVQEMRTAGILGISGAALG